MKAKRVLAAMLLLTSFWGCSEPVSSPPLEIILDLEDAELVLGSVDGPIETAFWAISDAMLLGDSAILVVDRIPVSFRVFTREGRFDYQFGGAGQGPGEFQSISSVFLRGDTLIAFDARGGRVSRFLTSGEFLDSEPAPFFMPELVAVTSSGQFVWAHDYQERAEGESVSEFYSSLSSSVGPVGDPSLISDFDAGWRFSGTPYPTTPIPSVIQFRDSVLVSAPNHGLIRLVAASDGGEREIAVPLDRIDRAEAWKAIGDELVNRDLADRARSLAEMPARPIPYFGSVLIAGEDRIWVKRYDPLEDSHWLGGWAGGEGGTYLVLDGAGRPLCEVTLAMRAVPLRVQSGYLLVLVRDDLDVEYLALMNLEELDGRPGG